MLFPVAGDPYYSSVSLLLPMTGANAGTTFTDVSPTPKTVTRYNALISTAQSKWGNGSGYFDGTDDYLTITHADMALETNDFCLEVWCWRSTTPTTNVDSLMHFLATTGINLEWNTSNNLGLFLHAAPTSYNAGSSTFNLSAWNHVALTRQSNVFRGFLNGVLQFTNEVTKNFTATTFYVGYDSTEPNRAYGAGYLQDLRVTKGVARYTADFAVPTGPLPARLVELPANRQVVQLPSHIAVAQLGL